MRVVMETSAPLLAPAVATSMRHASAVVRKQAALATLGLLRDAPLGMTSCATGSRGATEVRGFHTPHVTVRTLSMTAFRMCRVSRSSSCVRPVGRQLVPHFQGDGVWGPAGLVVRDDGLEAQGHCLSRALVRRAHVKVPEVTANTGLPLNQHEHVRFLDRCVRTLFPAFLPPITFARRF